MHGRAAVEDEMYARICLLEAKLEVEELESAAAHMASGKCAPVLKTALAVLKTPCFENTPSVSEQMSWDGR